MSVSASSSSSTTGTNKNPSIITQDNELEKEGETFLSGALAGIARGASRIVASLGRGSIAGTFAGMSEEITGFPLDLVKVCSLYIYISLYIISKSLYICTCLIGEIVYLFDCLFYFFFLIV